MKISVVSTTMPRVATPEALLSTPVTTLMMLLGSIPLSWFTSTAWSKPSRESCCSDWLYSPVNSLAYLGSSPTMAATE